MKANILNQLNRIATELPTIDGKNYKSYYGHQLLEMGIDQVEGVKVKPNKKYIGKSNDYLTHLKNLKELYRTRGPEGVKNYINLVQAWYKTIKTEPHRVDEARQVFDRLDIEMEKYEKTREI